MKRYDLFAVDEILIPRIYSIGFSDDPQVTRYGPSTRNHYILHYVLSGKGTFNGHGVEQGQGFLISPGTYEEYGPDEADPWAFVWIISEDPAMQHFFKCHHANLETGIFTFHDLHELRAVAHQLQAMSSNFSTSTQLAALFLRIFHTCIATENKHQSSVTELYFEFSVNYVKANLHLPISVDDLCRAIGITQPYLYRIFKQAAGCSPKQYISRCKLAEAKRLLLQTNLSVSQIADSVGFENALDFSKFFSRQTKLAPTAYRKSSEKKNGV